MKLSASASLVLPVGVLLLAGIAGPRADERELAPAAAPATAPDVKPEGTAAADPDVEPAVAVAPVPATPVPASPDAATPALPLGEPSYDPALGRYVASYGAGRAVLTFDAALQNALSQTLARYAVPWGVTVLIEPGTGRVLAMAEHSREEPGRTGLALTPLAPAASIFKLVTAAALLEQGVSPDEQVCFHGGKHRLQPRLLSDDPRRDRRCLTLEHAFGKSVNVVFAKLAGRGLDAASLAEMASRFLFNASIPFVRPVAISPAHIDADPFALANTAAGFGPVRLSPLHAALLASIVANGGTFVPPALVDRVEGAPAPAVPPARQVIPPRVAAALVEMMRNTVTDGTARKAFRRASGALRGVEVAGKTGTLSDPSPFRDYTWFVGFAPVDHPRVAVATVIVNERLWRVHAPAVAREALEAYFRSEVALAPTGGGALQAAAR